MLQKILLQIVLVSDLNRSPHSQISTIAHEFDVISEVGHDSFAVNGLLLSCIAIRGLCTMVLYCMSVNQYNALFTSISEFLSFEVHLAL